MKTNRFNQIKYKGLNTNIEYAPGFPTYGIRGERNTNERSSPILYVCDLNYAQNKVQVDNRIRFNEPLSIYERTLTLNKDYKFQYKKGDLVIDNSGTLYTMYLNDVNKQLSLVKVYKFELEDDTNIFKSNADIVISNLYVSDTNYGTDNKGDERTSNTIVITADNDNTTNNIFQRLMFVSPDGTQKDKILDIYYDKATNSFVFKSDSKILFDTNGLQVKNNTTQEESSNDDYFSITDFQTNINEAGKFFEEKVLVNNFSQKNSIEEVLSENDRKVFNNLISEIDFYVFHYENGEEFIPYKELENEEESLKSIKEVLLKCFKNQNNGKLLYIEFEYKNIINGCVVKK